MRRHRDNVARSSIFFWHFLVDIVYLLALPVVFLIILIQSRFFLRPKYRRGLSQKLGCVTARQGDKPSFWVHAVSVGEVFTALPFITRLREVYPDWDVTISVSTFTGFEVASKHLPEIEAFYFPLDLSPVVARVFRRKRPTVVLLIELELWPNFLLTAQRRGVPTLVLNGRITERSSRRYRRGGFLTRRLFSAVSGYAVQNEIYRDRFLSLGARSDRVAVLGNLKHDQRPSSLASHGELARRALGWLSAGDLVLVGGSTHPGEECLLWRLWAQLKQDFPALRLVLVPRHPERLSRRELDTWAPAGAGCVVLWSTLRARVLESRSDGSAALEPEEVLVVDTVGELELFYALGDLVFVGGSLVAHGGQNLLEPARLGKPILHGPHVWNFAEEETLLGEHEAACRVADEVELAGALRRLLGDSAARGRMGGRALDLCQHLSGAVERHLAWIGEQL